MNFRTILVTLILLIIGAGTVQAQAYKTAAGVRLGYPSAASLKYFFSEQNALEVYAGGRAYRTRFWLTLSGAYQHHQPLNIEGLDGLQWYVGAGGTVFFIGNAYTNYGSNLIGIQGYLGLDWYPTPDLPLAFSVDWIPTIFLSDFFGVPFRGGYGTVAVRYILAE
jgi:hypothetical protein